MGWKYDAWQYSEHQTHTETQDWWGRVSSSRSFIPKLGSPLISYYTVTVASLSLTCGISHVLYVVLGNGRWLTPVAMSTTISSWCMGMAGPSLSCRASTITVVLSARSMRSFQNSSAVHPRRRAQDMPFGPWRAWAGERDVSQCAAWGHTSSSDFFIIFLYLKRKSTACPVALTTILSWP